MIGDHELLRLECLKLALHRKAQGAYDAREPTQIAEDFFNWCAAESDTVSDGAANKKPRK